ncbi:MAG: hypothetical protein FJZ96_11675 [Chloroflexi bacterium]|nr:hypothetical protein [Chloroflexota bacterium]
MNAIPIQQKTRIIRLLIAALLVSFLAALALPQPLSGSAGIVRAAAERVSASGIVINEVDIDNIDRIELRNIGAGPVDLGGWKLTASWYEPTQSLTYTIPAGFVLAAGAFVIVNEGTGVDTATDLYTSQSYLWDIDQLGSLALLDSADQGVDFVRWGASAVPPPAGDNWTGTNPTPSTSGWTIGRNAASADTDDGGDWCSQLPSLNAVNNACSSPAPDLYEPDNNTGAAKPLAVGEVQLHNIVPVGDVDWMKFTVTEPTSVRIVTASTVPFADTKMWIYSSDDLINPIYYNDDYSGVMAGVETSCNIRVLIPGRTYYVRVAELNDPPKQIPSYSVTMTNLGPCTPTFGDVPFTHSFHDYIEVLYDASLTAGCSSSPLNYCPSTILNRAQYAVWVLKGELGVGYTPPPEPWNTFGDNWAPGPWAEKWAEGMYAEGLTSGCSSSPLLFCPWTELPREQISVFALKLMFGQSYFPGPATGIFADMVPSYWATKWAEQAYLNGLLPECGWSGGQPLFCPSALVDRSWGAYVIVKAKDLMPPVTP